MKRILLALLITLLPASALAWTHGLSNGTAPTQTRFSAAPLGAGGFILNIAVMPNGAKLVQTDVGGCYIWRVGATRWAQLISTVSMPAGFNSTGSGYNCYIIAFAPSNLNHLYMYFDDGVYTSLNQGQTWTKTNSPSNPVSSNGQPGGGPTMAVDPVNENVVYVSVPSVGVYVTTNGGTAWTLIPSGTITPGGGASDFGRPQSNIIMFDPSSTVTGGQTTGIYVQSYGVGVYHSTNAGASWTLMPSSPTKILRWAIDNTGKIYAAQYNTTPLSVYSGGAWSSVTTGLQSGTTLVAIDPANNAHVVAVAQAGYQSMSVDSGAHWSPSGVTLSFVQGVDIPWLGWALNQVGAALVTSAAFDPTLTNTLYFSMGIGVMWNTPSAVANAAVTYTTQSIGIEELVANKGLSVPGGSFLTATWDRPFFNTGPLLPNVFPAMYGTPGSAAVPIVAGWDLDYQGTNPAYIVGLANFTIGNSTKSGYSTDGGVNWNLFATPPIPEFNAEVGGAIAVDNAGDIITAGCGTGYMALSQNGGVSWTSVTSLPNSGWCAEYFITRQVLTSDKVEPHTFYAANETNGYLRSQNGGSTWTVMHPPGVDCCGREHWNVKLRASPTRAEELFYTSGSQSGTVPVDQPFHRSQDGGATWTDYNDVLEVYAFGFGAPAPGQTAAALWLYGWVNCNSTTIAVSCLAPGAGFQGGVFVSVDDMVSMRQVSGLTPGNSPDTVVAVSGDMNSWGRFFIGFIGSGFMQGILPDAVLYPIVSLQNVNTATPAQATITWQTDLASAVNSVDYGVTRSYGANAPASSGLSPTITLTGLSNYTTYHYRTRSGSAASMDLTFRTANTVAPGAPPSLTATPFDDATINLAWGPATGDPQGIAGYKVYEGGSLIATLTGTGTTYQVAGLEPSTAYTFTVTGYDASGNEGSHSSPASATTPAAGVIWTATEAANFIGATSASVSFPSVNVGAPATNKIIVACVDQDSIHVPTGVTMNGTPMTLVADGSSNPGVGAPYGPNGVQMYRGAAPGSGSTANFVVTLSGFVSSPLIAVGMQVGSLVTTHPTPSASGVAPWWDGYTLSPPIVVPSFGIAIMCGTSAGYMPLQPNPFPPVTWVVGTPDNWSDVTPPAFSVYGGMGHLYSSGSQAPQISSNANGFGMAVGAWAP